MRELINQLESMEFDANTISKEEGYLLTAKYVTYFYNSKKFYSLNGTHSSEDLVQEIYCKFLAKGFFPKYNPQVTSKKYFVMNAVRNSLIDMLRKHRDTYSLDRSVSAEDDCPMYAIIPSKENVEGEYLDRDYVEDLLKSLPDESNSKVVGETPLCGMSKMTDYCIGVHLFNGYTVSEMASWFINPSNGRPVSSSSISARVKEVREILKVSMEYLSRA